MWSSLTTRDIGRQDVYEAAQVSRLLERIITDDAAIGSFLGQRRAPAVTLYYEDLCDDQTLAVAAVLALIYGRPVELTDPPKSTMRQQADHVTEEWLQRYRVEHSER